MNKHIYWITRWVLFGLFFGWLAIISINKDVGWGWMAGYTLCWIFSYLKDALLGADE